MHLNYTTTSRGGGISWLRSTVEKVDICINAVSNWIKDAWSKKKKIKYKHKQIRDSRVFINGNKSTLLA